MTIPASCAFLTELMSNSAAAAPAFTVTLGVASTLGLDPQPFVMAVIYGASCSFLTPNGYQTNLMIMSPGRYRLAGFVRAGLPVSLVFLAVALGVPLALPFVARQTTRQGVRHAAPGV